MSRDNVLAFQYSNVCKEREAGRHNRAYKAYDVLPPFSETLALASIPHIVSYKAGLMAGWYNPWVG